jgi:hypothetical protein
MATEPVDDGWVLYVPNVEGAGHEVVGAGMGVRKKSRLNFLRRNGPPSSEGHSRDGNGVGDGFSKRQEKKNAKIRRRSSEADLPNVAAPRRSRSLLDLLRPSGGGSNKNKGKQKSVSVEAEESGQFQPVSSKFHEPVPPSSAAVPPGLLRNHSDSSLDPTVVLVGAGSETDDGSQSPASPSGMYISAFSSPEAVSRSSHNSDDQSPSDIKAALVPGMAWGYDSSRSQQHVDVHSLAIVQRLRDAQLQASEATIGGPGGLSLLSKKSQGKNSVSPSTDATLSPSPPPKGGDSPQRLGDLIRSQAFSTTSSPGRRSLSPPPLRRVVSQPDIAPPRATQLQWDGPQCLTAEKEPDRRRKCRSIRSMKTPLRHPASFDPNAPLSPQGVVVPYAPHFSEATSKYKLLGRKFVQLHSGGFGRYTIARENETGNLVVVKVFERHAFSEADEETQRKAEESIATERRVLESHCSPFIISAAASFQDGAHLYIILNFSGGEDMSSILRRVGRFNLDATAFLVAEIVDALIHLHEMSIAHRAISPECVLIDEWGHVCLSDFGHAKAASGRSSGSKTICGIDPYSSPEMRFSKKGSGMAADWWSVGVVTCRMLAGVLPISTVLLPDLEEELANGIAALPYTMPSRARMFIEATMYADPVDRLQDAKEVREHPFFSHLNWHRISTKDYIPQYRPSRYSFLQILAERQQTLV